MAPDPDSPASPPPAPHPARTASPATPAADAQRKKNLYLRLVSSMPLAVTVLVHLILFAIAGAVVIQQNVIGKKKTFEAAPPAENTQAQVEHRLQVARRGGAAGASGSPVEVNRLFSTADNALQLPPLPDLPSLAGPGGFGGFGGMGAGVGLGQGVGTATSLGSGVAIGGRGFMSMSFLGITDQNVQNVLFIVDVSPRMMDLRKSGFRAFEIIRNEMGSLIGRLPPAAKFNVMLFGGATGRRSGVNSFRGELVPATTENKEAFFAWIKPVNTHYEQLGPQTAASFNEWQPRAFPEGYGFDPTINRMNRLANLIQAGIEQQPDSIFLITGEVDLRPGSREPPSPDFIRRARARWDAGADERRQRRADYEKAIAELAARGITQDSVARARRAAEEKATADFAEGNRRLVAAGRPPVVNIRGLRAIEERLDEIRKAGIDIKIDGRGWKVDDQGNPIRFPASPPGETFNPPVREDIEWNEVHLHINRLQRAFTAQKVAITTMLFVGPEESEDRVMDWSAPLREISKRNDGKFQVLTTKRLEEILAAQAAQRGGGSP
jgi:hypothetical protein